MRGLLLLLTLIFALAAVAPEAVAVEGWWRCRSRCKDRIKACKRRCKRSGARWKVRRRCYKRCKKHYIACKKRCRVGR
jgi:hypothetical protein